MGMSEQSQLLAASDGTPVSEVNVQGSSDVLLVCEHASRKLPASLGTLGLSPEALEAHIAWDPGALAVAKRMSGLLDAALIFQNFSRLAYDCNRPPQALDAMPPRSEIFDIPGNMSLSVRDRALRTTSIYEPFRAAIARIIGDRQAQGRQTVVITVHSFTPVYKGVEREVEIGILHDTDARLADQMLALAGDDPGYRILRNEPYGPADGVTHTLKEHGLANGLLNVMIEIRNDLIRDEAGQEVMAGFLAGLIRESLSIPA
jgi:predicted N-formylglutamate amidohydrolase